MIMGKRNNKRKDRNSSGNDAANDNNRKIVKLRGPSSDSEQVSLSISELLNETNSVLYNEVNYDSSVFTVNTDVNAGKSDIVENMADNSEPTNRDIMNCLQGISKRRLDVETKLGALDLLEKKVSNFEKELKSIWLAIDDRAKKLEERVAKIEDKVDGTDIGVAMMSSKVTELEKAKDSIREEMAYIKSQSMRNNLVFTKIPEDNSGGNETPEVTERKLREHLHEAMKISKEMAEQIRFERVHRTPGQPLHGKTHNIVAKFSFFKDREFVRKEWKQLKGTQYSVFEQYPPEVIEKRRKLVPKMKIARQQGKSSWIAYDTLYIDGSTSEGVGVRRRRARHSILECARSY